MHFLELTNVNTNQLQIFALRSISEIRKDGEGCIIYLGNPRGSYQVKESYTTVKRLLSDYKVLICD